MANEREGVEVVERALPGKRAQDQVSCSHGVQLKVVVFDLYLHGYGARLGTFSTGPLKQSGSRYVTQASLRLKGTSTLQGCWGQPAASEGRPQAPPPQGESGRST